MNESSRKKTSELFQVKTADEFLSTLTVLTGRDIEEAIRSTYDDVPDGVGCLLVGSLSEGLGHPASDVDLLLLPPMGAILKRGTTRALRLRVGDRDEALEYAHGIELNWEVLNEAFADRVRGAMNGVTNLLAQRSSIRELPILSVRDLRTLHRLRSGWVLTGREAAEEWRDYCFCDVLPEYLSLVHYMNYCEMSEDIRSLLTIEYEREVLLTMWQMACRDALMCARAVTRVSTNPSEKWVGSHADLLPPEARVVHTSWSRSVFTGDGLFDNPSANIAALELALETCIATDELVKHACDMFKSFIHYA